MSGLTFRLKVVPDQRLDVAELTPRRLASLSHGEIEERHCDAHARTGGV